MADEQPKNEQPPTQTETPSPTSIVDVAKNAPRWAQGVAAVLAALVAVVLAFHIDVGAIVSSGMSNAADQQKATLQIQLEKNAAEAQNTQRFIESLNAAIQAQNLRLAELTKENQDLKAEVLKLQLQVREISFRCGLAVLTPTATPASEEQP